MLGIGIIAHFLPAKLVWVTGSNRLVCNFHSFPCEMQKEKKRNQNQNMTLAIILQYQIIRIKKNRNINKTCFKNFWLFFNFEPLLPLSRPVIELKKKKITRSFGQQVHFNMQRTYYWRKGHKLEEWQSKTINKNSFRHWIQNKWRIWMWNT